MKRVNIKCPYCRSQAFLRPASVVYGQGHGEPNTELYVCARYPACNAYVAAHRHNHLPMGTLANRELRRKRVAAHAAFNRLWQSGLMTKRAAYADVVNSAHWQAFFVLLNGPNLTVPLDGALTAQGKGSDHAFLGAAGDPPGEQLHIGLGRAKNNNF